MFGEVSYNCSYCPGAVALSLDGKERQILSAHNQIDAGSLLSNVFMFYPPNQFTIR